MDIISRVSVLLSSCLILAQISCSNLTSKLTRQDLRKTPKSNSNLSIPNTWKANSRGENAKISTGWLHAFDSPAMTKVVLAAVDDNPDLKASAARLRASKLGTIGSKAAKLPSINTLSSAARTRSGNGSALRSLSSSYSITLNASWEPDLWGRLGDLREADLSDYKASLEDFRAARLSLAASTARAYCDLVTAEQLLKLAKITLQSFKKNRDIIERNYKAGVPGTRAIAVQFSRNNVASAQRTLKSRILQRNLARRTLESLLGRYPSAELITSHALPKLSNSVPASIPASLLTRRPDIIAAQHRIYSSAKMSEASAKNLLPSINLNTSASTARSSVSNLFNPQFLAFSIAASLTQSIYRGGELKANAQAALERNKAAIFDYTSIAIQAFREIENALETDRSLHEQEQFLIQETKQAALAERSAELDYSEGVESSGILEILESQQRANNARAALIKIKNSRLQNRIDLHLALGGNFTTQ